MHIFVVFLEYHVKRWCIALFQWWFIMNKYWRYPTPTSCTEKLNSLQIGLYQMQLYKWLVLLDGAGRVLSIKRMRCFFSPFFLLLVPKLVAVHTKALQVRDMFFGHRCFWILWKVLIFLCLLKVYSISLAPQDILVW